MARRSVDPSPPPLRMSMEHGRDLEFDGEERDLSEASMAYEYFCRSLA
jgi:hypothetical protein